MPESQCPSDNVICHPFGDLSSAQEKALRNSEVIKTDTKTNISNADAWAKDQLEYLKQQNSTMSQSGHAFISVSEYFKSYQDRLAYYFSLGTNNKWVMWTMIVLVIIILYRWIRWMFAEEIGRKKTRRVLWTLMLIILVFFLHTLLLAYF